MELRFADFVGTMPSRRRTVLGILAAAIMGAVLTLISWYVLKTLTLPAFGSSNITRAFSTIVLVTVIIILSATSWWRLRLEHARLTPDEPLVAWKDWLTTLILWIGPAGIVVGATAIPLAPTKLWLDGISVDQQFRTQFLTRMTDSFWLTDMNYKDIPSYYPGLWFWFGGRLANLMGLEGWEVYQPWALISLAAAGCMLVPVWHRLSGSLVVGAGTGVASIAIALVVGGAEPYSAIVALGGPAGAIMAGRALAGDRFALIGATLYLGFSAATYTVFTVVTAVTVAFLGVMMAIVTHQSIKPILNGVLMAMGAGVIALISWGPYLWAVINGAPKSGATALHYLPMAGALIPLPFFSLSIIGLLCLVGLIYYIVRLSDSDVRFLASYLVIAYGWVIASMVTSLAGTTLLGFRLDVLVVLILATGGVIGIAELRVYGLSSIYPEQLTAKGQQVVTTVMITVLCFAAIAYAQRIPILTSAAIDRAYTDTDGDGNRADLFAPGPAAFYSSLDAEIQSKFPSDRAETVVLADEKSFLAFYPYASFQAMTSHYANPLGQFDQRNARIQRWADDSWDILEDPAQFATALDASPWEPPEVFIFRGSVDDTVEGWKFDLAEDIYPNDPNVRFTGITFNPLVFNPERWATAQVGPFVVVSRIAK